ncbi:MAG: hypothetical protein ACYSUQ_08505 [Planctomycetota bacterium]|jgi:predicted RNA-binding Zn-ribbon protein involved in translation (DUF1610 family)
MKNPTAKMTLMAEAPRFLCPQCGRTLRGSSSSTCPDCGYLIAQTRVQYRGALRYWRLLRSRRRIEYVVTFLWCLAAGLAYWLLSLSPTRGVVALTVMAAAMMVALSKYLLLRRPTKKKN